MWWFGRNFIFIRRARFAGIKSYCMEPWDASEQLQVRSKGLSQKVRDSMDASHFTIDNSRRVFFESMHLKPTMGGEIAITRKSRIMNSTVNMKRCMHAVSKKSSKKLLGGQRLFFRIEFTRTA